MCFFSSNFEILSKELKKKSWDLLTLLRGRIEEEWEKHPQMITVINDNSKCIPQHDLNTISQGT